MSASPVIPTPDGVLVEVWVVPGASRTSVGGLHGGRLRVSVTAPAEAGRANQAVADALEEAIGGNVSLRRGMRTRAKVFSVAGVDAEEVREKLGV